MTHPLRRAIPSLLLLAILAAAPRSLPAQAPAKKNFTLEEILMGGKFMGRGGIRGFKWLKSGDRYSYLDSEKGSKTQGIYAASAATGKAELLVDLGSIKEPGADNPISMSDYTWSPDESKILFTLDVKALWRYSRTAHYFVYTLKDGSLKGISKGPGDVMNAKFSPDSRKVGFVRGGDIYVYDIASDTETRLTTDGAEHLFNGKFGWVYEEEFSITDGWRWSPDGSRIAFWQENESNVPEYTLTDWMPLHQELTKIRYPKPGDPNPVMRIGVVSLDTKQIRWMDIGADTDIYIPRIQWTADPSTLSIIRLNRLQNHLELLFADAAAGDTRLVLEEKTSGWFDVESDFPLFLGDKKQFLWRSERDGWDHLYMYDYSGKQVSQVTKGEWEVDDVVRVDETHKTIFYSSTEPSPIERHLYSIRFDGSKKTRLTAIPGSHSFDMSPSGDYFIDRYSSVTLPPQQTMRDREGAEVRKIVENKGEAFADYNMARRELITFMTADGLTLYASILKPPDFDPDRKYPVLFDVYGGPGSQSVRNSWTGLYHQLLAQKGYIVFQMDPRGTGARGAAFKFMSYKRLGAYEVADFVEGARFLASQKYVDPKRIGIWGWSYGGYAAAMTLLKAGDYFKAAIAVAPVTDWRFYDTIYTERYMQRPADNPDGYAKGSCAEFAKDLKGELLLVHGGQDDNVHLQNSVHLIDALEKANKQFETRIYPNGNHGIGGGNIRLNLYTMMLEFLEKNL